MYIKYTYSSEIENQLDDLRDKIIKHIGIKPEHLGAIRPHPEEVFRKLQERMNSLTVKLLQRQMRPIYDTSMPSIQAVDL